MRQAAINRVTMTNQENHLKVISRKMKADGFDPATIQKGPGAEWIEEFVKQVVYDAISEAEPAA